VWLTNIYYAFVHPYLMYGNEICYLLYTMLLTWISWLRLIINYSEYFKISLLLPLCQLYTSFNLLSIDKCA